MHGHQLTFYTLQQRMHGHQPLTQWLLTLAHEMGLRGATLTGALQGLGHDGQYHATTLFDVADQPVQITLVLTPDEEQGLMERLNAESVQLFYTRSPVEFGTTGHPGNNAPTPTHAKD